MIKNFTLMSLLFFAPTGWAAANSQDHLGMTFVVLFAVVALAYFLVLMFKKMRLTHMLGSQSKLKIITQLAVGQKERLVVVDVNGEQLLLGITPTQIQLIKKLQNPIQVVEKEKQQDLSSENT